MGESKRNPNQKRHQRAPKPVALTPEQQAELKAAQEKAAVEAKAAAERLQNWEKSVEKMSYRQLRAEVTRVIRKERVKVGKDTYEPIAGLTIAFATVFDNVLANTQSKENPFAKLSHYVR
jgi:hypothetical protein